MKSTIPKILFVDDEQNILNSLQRLLHNEDWDCLFLTNAREALDYLKTEPVDLVVVDVMMPDMDGIQLVTEIRRLYPGIIRMFLTGFAKNEQIVKALVEGHTQQIIPKPWIDQELIEIIRSALRQCAQQKKHSVGFQTLINSIPLLPALPESYSNVRSCIVGDEINIEKMAEYISQDVAISSALLHWANSALFGQRFQVDTIKKAIIVLGTDIVENLVLSEAIKQTIAGKANRVKGFDFIQFEKHSMATAVISRLLIKSLHSTNLLQHDRAFIAGLLHDMGKLAATSFIPDKFEKAIHLAITKKCSVIDAEMATYATHHAEIGSYLAEWWTLPAYIIQAIRWHHQPEKSPVNQDIIAAAHVANLLSYQFNYGATTHEVSYPREISDEFRNKFYLTEEALEILQAETDKVIQELRN